MLQWLTILPRRPKHTMLITIFARPKAVHVNASTLPRGVGRVPFVIVRRVRGRAAHAGELRVINMKRTRTNPKKDVAIVTQAMMFTVVTRSQEQLTVHVHGGER